MRQGEGVSEAARARVCVPGERRGRGASRQAAVGPGPGTHLLRPI